MQRWLVAILLLATGAGCSENFGDAPRAGTRLGVRSATPVGPVLPRAALAMTKAEGALLLATDRGMYRLRPTASDAQWYGEHPGFITAQGDASPQFLQAVHASPSGRNIVHNVAVGVGEQDMLLFVSEDGGARYREVGRPVIATRQVDQILALDPSSSLPEGGFLSVQGAEAFLLRTSALNWESWALPAAPLSIDAVGIAASGDALLAVRTAAGSEVWVASPGANFRSTPFLATPPLLAVARDAAGRIIAISDSALYRDGERWPLEIGEAMLSASLAASSLGSVRYAMLTTLGLRSGIVDAALNSAASLPANVTDIAPVLDGAATWLVTPGASLLRFEAGEWDQFSFAGADLWWSALAVDRRQGLALLLGNRNTGRVHRQRDGEAWQDLAALLLNSRAKFVAPGPESGEGLWLGSFGLYRWEMSGVGGPAVWRQRTQGMQSYLLLGSEDLMEMQTIAFDPRDLLHVWTGATEGNGPYESHDGGLTWSRRHAGLGTPGSLPEEDGLPNCAQVRAFALDDGETWMGSFRGGVFEFVAGSWQQRNKGLPDAWGAVLDTCCFEPAQRVVDVRDLLATPAGGLLAATGFGIFRDDERDGSWAPSGAGLSNGDIYALARHPSAANWILAAARGTFSAGDWLFLSTDAGRTWQPVDTGTVAVFCTHVAWTEGLSCVAILDGRGALHLELDP